MEWDVLFDEKFAEWFEALDEGLQDEILAHVRLLRQFRPNLGRPRADTVKGSKYPNMKELRIQEGDE
ncbi:MAG: type II toxin-antitoxin system RelE/ParE family toxin [Isosphaeraceae bacterium]